MHTDIRVNSRDKLLEIWLTQNERNRPEVSQILRSAADIYMVQDYLPVIYESGAADLKENTVELLLHNNRLLNKKPDFMDHSI